MRDAGKIGLSVYRSKRLIFNKVREVAQAGSAPGLGPGGRRFESCLPDLHFEQIRHQCRFAHLLLKRLADCVVEINAFHENPQYLRT